MTVLKILWVMLLGCVITISGLIVNGLATGTLTTGTAMLFGLTQVPVAAILYLLRGAWKHEAGTT